MIVLFILIVTWLVRLYVRHMLKLAGINVGDVKPSPVIEPTVLRIVKTKITAPVEAGLLDLKENMKNTFSWFERFKSNY